MALWRPRPGPTAAQEGGQHRACYSGLVSWNHVAGTFDSAEPNGASFVRLSEAGDLLSLCNFLVQIVPLMVRATAFEVEQPRDGSLGYQKRHAGVDISRVHQNLPKA